MPELGLGHMVMSGFEWSWCGSCAATQRYRHVTYVRMVYMAGVGYVTSFCATHCTVPAKGTA